VIVQLISKFEIYETYLHGKDKVGSSAGDAFQDGARTTLPKNNCKILTSTPPAFIICQCKDESYINVVENENVMLSLSYLKGSYVMSKPTGYTNLAISATYLA